MAYTMLSLFKKSKVIAGPTGIHFNLLNRNHHLCGCSARVSTVMGVTFKTVSFFQVSVREKLKKSMRANLDDE